MNPETLKRFKPVQHDRGAVMVEFALVLPFLLIVIVAVMELGLILIQDNTLNKSVRESARYMSLNWNLNGCFTNIAQDIVTENMNRLFAFSDDFAGGGGTVTIEQICIDESDPSGPVSAASGVNANCTGAPNFCTAPQHLHIRATATFPHQMIITNLMGINFQPTLSATSIMRVIE